MAGFVDGTLTVSPDIDHLSEIGPQIFAAMIEEALTAPTCFVISPSVTRRRRQAWRDSWVYPW